MKHTAQRLQGHRSTQILRVVLGVLGGVFHVSAIFSVIPAAFIKTIAEQGTYSHDVLLHVAYGFFHCIAFAVLFIRLADEETPLTRIVLLWAPLTFGASALYWSWILS